MYQKCNKITLNTVCNKSDYNVQHYFQLAKERKNICKVYCIVSKSQFVQL